MNCWKIVLLACLQVPAYAQSVDGPTATQRKQWAATHAAELRAMFEKWIVSSRYSCNGCTLKDYSTKGRWIHHNVGNPATVRFEVSPDGGSVLFYWGYSYTPYGGYGELPPKVGIPGGPRLGDLRWREPDGKPIQISFGRSDSDGRPHSEMIFNAPAGQRDAGFDPNARYDYFRGIASPHPESR